MLKNETETKQINLLKTTAGLISVIAVVFGAVGFLSIRSYINRLGVPANAELSVDGYLQYGGRVFFTLCVHLVPVLLVIYLFRLLGAASAKKLRHIGAFFQKYWLQVALICLLAAATFLAELLLLNPKPIFSPGERPSVSGEFSDRTSVVFLIEGSIATTVFILWRLLKSFREATSTSDRARLSISIAVLSVLSVIILFPVCFGAIAMVPTEFDVVSIQTEEPARIVEGILVFSDKNSYFVWSAENRMAQVPRSKVNEITYRAKWTTER